MKSTKKAFAVTAIAVAAAAATLGLAACKDDPKPKKPTDKPHDCTQVCPDCGGCLDMLCENSGCYTKCGDDYSYDMTFESTDMKVAKTNVTVVPTGYITDYNKTAGGSIVYTFEAEEAGKATLEAYVSKTSERDLFTDVISVSVNGGEALERPSVIPALKDGEAAAASMTEINLGCIDLNAGINTIAFVANGDGAHAHNFYKITVIGDTDYTLRQATEITHTCTQECDVCGYCTAFSCYNPGCEHKCECVSGDETNKIATLFWVCDEHVETSRAVNPELDGIGCTWNQETRVVYNIVAPKDVTVKYGAVVSADKKDDVLFTDQFDVVVNGEKVAAGTGCMPASENGNRDWNTYSLVVVGEMTLKEGRNEIVVSQTPSHDKTDSAYNFQSLVIFGTEDDAYSWYNSEHKLQKVDAAEPNCYEDGNIEHYMCVGHCDKLFADKYAEHELTEDEVLLPVNPDLHVIDFEDLEDGDASLTCYLCEHEVPVTVFNAGDDKCLFTGTKKDGYCEGKNNTKTVITFNIESDKAGKIKMYVNDSSIINAWNVNFNATWKVYVNDVEYTSSTVHHNTAGTGVDASDRFTDFHYEYVCDINLIAGKNEIVFSSVGAGDELNFKDLAFLSDGYTLDWYIAPVEYIEEVPSTCTVAGTKGYWLDNSTGKKYKDEELTQEYGDGELALPLDDSKHGKEKLEDGVVTCSDCNTFIRKEILVNDSRNEASKATNGDGIGSSWGAESKVTFTLYSAEAGERDLYVTISQDSVAYKLTDFLSIYVNGSEDKLDTDAQVKASDGRHWTTYDTIKVGKINLNAGKNTIVVSFTPNHASAAPDQAVTEVAINFLKIAIAEQSVDFMYTKVAAKDGDCANAGNIEYYVSTADGKKYSDKDLKTELTDEEIIIPADPTKHVGKLDENGTTIVCENCEHVMGANFNGMDDRCEFTGANKNTNEQCLPGSSGVKSVITYHINADKAGAVKLYTNVSAIAGSWNVEYSKTWGVTVNGAEVASDTIHHNDSTRPSDIANRYSYYVYEFVAEIELVEGENTIVFTATGAEALNFRDMALMGDGLTLTWYEEEEGDPSEDETELVESETQE